MMTCHLASTAQLENMGIAILFNGTKPKRLPELHCTIIPRVHGDAAAEEPRVIQKSQGKHPADAATAHPKANVETPHPQRFPHGGFDGHAADSNECCARKGAEQPFAVTRETDIANCPLIDKPADMEITFLPGVARKPRHRLRQTVTEVADFDRHGDVNATRRQEPVSRAASPRLGRRPV